MNSNKSSKCKILFEHNLALKIMLDYGTRFIGKDYQVTFKDKEYKSKVEEIIVDPIDFRGADILIKSRFLNLENRMELLTAGLGTMRFMDYLAKTNQEDKLFEQYPIIYSMAVPPVVEDIDDYISN